MVYWKGGDVPNLADKAQKLGTLLGKAPYKFIVAPHEIDYKGLGQYDIEDNFKAALNDVEERLRARDKETSSLLILYYGGHGVVDRGDRWWSPTKSSGKRLLWSKYQPRMYDLNCEILYLFDCCYSLAMVETASTNSQHRRRCEILCSSGLKEPSGAQNKTLFTEALRQLLATKRDNVLDGTEAIGGLTFENICITMTGEETRRNLIAEPRWQVVAPNPAHRGKITFTKKGAGAEALPPPPQRHDSDSGYESQIESFSQLSDTWILIKIRLTNPAEGLSSNDWLKWFEDRPHNVAHVDIAVLKKIEWVGVFESDSSLALVTVPLWLWQNMERDPACESLGTVRSKNLLRKPPAEIASALPSDPDVPADSPKKQQQAPHINIMPLTPPPSDPVQSTKRGIVKEHFKAKADDQDPPRLIVQARIPRPDAKKLGRRVQKPDVIATVPIVSLRLAEIGDLHKRVSKMLPDGLTGHLVSRRTRVLG